VGGEASDGGNVLRTQILFACLVGVKCAVLTTGARAMAEVPEVRDLHSAAHPERARVRRVELDLTVSFDREELAGSATLFVERTEREKGAPLVLDTRGLVIEGVEGGGAGGFHKVPHTLGSSDPILGAPLTVDLPEGDDRVRVRYRTGPGAKALQWVGPSRTAGGKHPFVFTQSQAIQARSWLPIQDSPGVRLTFGATIRVPDGLRAVMGAEAKGHAEAIGGLTAFAFEMPEPIPAYLIALAVGDLQFRELGPRTGVYAEPPVIAKAAHEFADAEKMVEVAARRYGPYRWGRYDILVLPPSFPFGGMENPRLTFATPTILAGDRSLVSLIAHELAHSWSGNLVTNASWRDFWLNEGFTTYIERRIVEDLFGAEQAEMEAVLGLRKLLEDFAKLPASDHILHIDLAGRDPDDGMTHVPYEKGALFLATLEHAVGRERFDAFVKGYFDHFAFRGITTADFETYLAEHLAASQFQDPVDVRAWLHDPGLPNGYPRPVSARFSAVDDQARHWLDRKVAATELKTAGWSTLEWLRFLQAMPVDLPAARLAELDAAFGLTALENAEIAQEWLLMAIRAGYEPADARLDAFLTSVGRRKYLMPLYGEMAKTDAGLARARAIFSRAKASYHPIAAESVERLLSKPAEEPKP